MWREVSLHVMSERASRSCSSCGRSVPRERWRALTMERPCPTRCVGQHLGEYVVRRHLGSGGMGIVYEGEHLTIGRKAAIKLLREEHSQGAHARGLLAEARAASAIHHHGIIDIFGFGQQPGVGQYLVMEYLEGRPLDELIQARAPLPLAEAVALLCEVLDALSAAHAVGVIHRDLKPSNIFVARQSNGTESIKVLDFGLAKRSTTPQGTAPQTHSDVIVGTPQYMAPEQALCQEVGPQTDLYAVGVIAFELLTGQRPFTGRSPMEIVAHHLNTPPPAPSLFVALPPEARRARPPAARQGAPAASRLGQRSGSRAQGPAPAPGRLRPVLGCSELPLTPVLQPPPGAAPAPASTQTLQPSPATPGPAGRATRCASQKRLALEMGRGGRRCPEPGVGGGRGHGSRGRDTGFPQPPHRPPWFSPWQALLFRPGDQRAASRA